MNPLVKVTSIMLTKSALIPTVVNCLFVLGSVIAFFSMLLAIIRKIRKKALTQENNKTGVLFFLLGIFLLMQLSLCSTDYNQSLIIVCNYIIMICLTIRILIKKELTIAYGTTCCAFLFLNHDLGAIISMILIVVQLIFVVFCKGKEDKKMSRMPVSISITHPPNTVNYVEGMQFQPNGMEVSIFYDNGNIETMTYQCQHTKMTLVAGQTEIILSYTEGERTVFVTQPITVSKETPVFVVQ